MWVEEVVLKGWGHNTHNKGGGVERGGGECWEGRQEFDGNRLLGRESASFDSVTGSYAHTGLVTWRHERI